MLRFIVIGGFAAAVAGIWALSGSIQADTLSRTQDGVQFVQQLYKESPSHVTRLMKAHTRRCVGKTLSRQATDIIAPFLAEAMIKALKSNGSESVRQAAAQEIIAQGMQVESKMAKFSDAEKTAIVAYMEDNTKNPQFLALCVTSGIQVEQTPKQAPKPVEG